MCDRLRGNCNKLREWGDNLERGNLELQDYKRKYEDGYGHTLRLQDETRQLRADLDAAHARIREREAQLANAHKALREHGFDAFGERSFDVGMGERKTREELDDWVRGLFSADFKREAEFKRLVDEVEIAGWKQLPGRLQTLKVFLDETSKERSAKKGEWSRVIGLGHPQHVIEQQFIAVVGRQPLVGQAWGAHHDFAQFAGFGMYAVLHFFRGHFRSSSEQKDSGVTGSGSRRRAHRPPPGRQ